MVHCTNGSLARCYILANDPWRDPPCILETAVIYLNAEPGLLDMI